MNSDPRKIRKPYWLKTKLPTGKKYSNVKNIVNKYGLKTICQSGNCPNIAECWSDGTATFLILGERCTRNCTFCNVSTGKAEELDSNEPSKVAKAVKLMGLKHCVITSVTRDDLNDKGALHWATTINEIRKLNPGITMEVLIPDMNDDIDALNLILNTKPEIVSHNMETVKRLYKTVRPQANYERSLRQIELTAKSPLKSKSGFMLGLGEKDDEVFEVIDDLSNVNLDILTIGQYLQPSKEHYNLVEFVKPEKFIEFKKYAYNKGIKLIESAPLVRSSYHSEQQINVM
ncbi:MAG: lipoyl synthase [Bacteroidota bacterium]|nr:lipoyl synthase [Bacteroidota bacterium]